VTNNKLPEVGEFWEYAGYRRKILAVHRNECVTLRPDVGLQIQSARMISDNWKHLPWCKSFDDGEPKPVTEEIEFREYICGQELKWLSWTPADAIPTGLVRKVKVKK